jgi:hypothetical protein
MKRIFLSLFVVIALTACNNEEKVSETVADNGPINANVSPAADATNSAAFKFEKESYDFGQITEGEQVSYEFSFTNVGKEPLIITSATATCGCTVPDYSREPIAPNGEGKISVKFDSKGKNGMQDKVITITANTVPATTQLHLIGDIKLAKKN